MTYSIRKNDRAKVVFLPDNTILWNVGSQQGKMKLPIDLYKQIFRLYKEAVIICVDTNQPLLNSLLEIGVVIEADSSFIKYNGTRYDKTNYLLYDLFDSNTIIDSIKTKRVMIIGLGGIGTEALNHFIAAGITQFVLIEHDTVSETNLNRQFIYKMADVGRNKVDVVAEYISDKLSGARVTTYKRKIESGQQLYDIISKEKNIDIIVCAADTPPCYIQKYITDVSLYTGVPCVFCGVGIEDGYVGPLLTDERIKKEYQNSFTTFIESKAQVFPSAGSFSITNTIISAYLANDVIMFLANKYDYVRSLNKTYNMRIITGDNNES